MGRSAYLLAIALVGVTAIAPGCGSDSSKTRDAGGDARATDTMTDSASTSELGMPADGGDANAPVPDGGDASAPVPDSGDASAPVPDSGDAMLPPNPALEAEFQVSGCVGLNGSALPCYWRYKYEASRCSPSAPCEKLVIYHSGGGMVCDEGFGDPAHYTSEVLQEYASDAYVAVCANIFLDRASFTFRSEAERLDLLQKAITSSSAINSIWTGEKLLITGISHGATAPVVAMATTNFDDGAAWSGSKETGACFLDGVYDLQATNAYLLSYPMQCNFVRQSVICDRYFGGDCAQFDPTDADYLADTVSKSSADSFAIKNWKLIECGSALPGCLGDRDWIPAAPIAELCANIDAGADHSCVDDPLPDEGHLSCSSGSGSTKCRTWFNAL